MVRVWLATTRLAVTANGRQAVRGTQSPSHSSQLQMWEPTTGIAGSVLPTGSTYPLAFSPTGKWWLVVASGHIDVDQETPGYLLDTHTWRVVAKLDGHLNRIHTAAFSADGRWLVTGSADRKAIVWDLTRGVPAP
jgi:WD40 repeat protein